MGQPLNCLLVGAQSVAPHLRPPLLPGTFETFPTWAKTKPIPARYQEGRRACIRSRQAPLLPFELLSSVLLSSVFCAFLGQLGVSLIPLVPSLQETVSWPQYTAHGVTLLVRQVSGSPYHPDLPFQSWRPGFVLGAVLVCRDLGPGSPTTKHETPTPGKNPVFRVAAASQGSLQWHTWERQHSLEITSGKPAAAKSHSMDLNPKAVGESRFSHFPGFSGAPPEVPPLKVSWVDPLPQHPFSQEEQQEAE